MHQNSKTSSEMIPNPFTFFLRLANFSKAHPKVSLIMLTLMCGVTTHGFSEDIHSATIVKCYGDAKLLTPLEVPAGGASQGTVRIDDKDYHWEHAKSGLEMKTGGILQTGQVGFCRLVYGNGDQITLGKNTFYQVGLEPQTSKTIIDLAFGSLRATIIKGGPRSNLEVKTRTMALGVRGTEFFVSSLVKEGEAQLTVLRGVVGVKVGSGSAPKEVSSGYTLTIDRSKDADQSKPAAVELRQTSKENLVAIVEETKIQKSLESNSNDNDAETEARIKALEENAKNATLADIKVEDPALFEKLKNSPNASTLDLDSLSTASVKNAYENIPEQIDSKTPSEKLPTPGEDDPYDRYFKGDE